jgi:transposase, IS5 family
MRQIQARQAPLAAPFLGHQQHARELAMVSRVLDDNPAVARLAHDDLTAGKRTDTGRPGLTGEQVVRIALLKQIHGLSYRELAFHLEDSSAFQTFARLPCTYRTQASTLNANIKRLRPQTWEAIHRHLVQYAKAQSIEDGRRVRVDCTAVESNIHHPTDSALLWDSVRVVTRLLHRIAEQLPAARVPFTDHTKRARRRVQAIAFPPNKRDRRKHRVRAYRDLLKVARKTYGYGRAAVERLRQEVAGSMQELIRAEVLQRQLRQVLDAMTQVIDQTTRRVLQGQNVPAEEKLVSIFETHTDIVIKAEREVVFGHKICLTGGRSSMILDCVIEHGNPADSTLVERTLQRHVDLYGKPPRQTAFDGGFASRRNLEIAKAAGVNDVAFHKKCGLQVNEMVQSAWVFRRLRHFRAGIEGVISTLKRAFGMDRCTWRSLASFQSYVWASVVSFNLIVIARHLLL